MNKNWLSAGKIIAMAALISGYGATGALAQEATTEGTPEERTIVKRVIVNAPRAEVWRALTTTEGVTTFFAPNAYVDLRMGGAYEMYWDLSAEPGSRGSEGCEILSFVREEVLSFTWNAPTRFPKVRGSRTYVVIQLSDGDADQTVVRLTNGGYKAGGEWDGAYDYFTAAWGTVLANLQKRFESGPRWSKADTHAVPPANRRRYVYFLRPVRPELINAPTEHEMATITRHFRYLRGLLASNKLILAGRARGEMQLPDPESDMVALKLPAPGIVVFEAESPEEARSIMQNDPAVKAGVFKACVDAFGLALLKP